MPTARKKRDYPKVEPNTDQLAAIAFNWALCEQAIKEAEKTKDEEPVVVLTFEWSKGETPPEEWEYEDVKNAPIGKLLRESFPGEFDFEFNAYALKEFLEIFGPPLS